MPDQLLDVVKEEQNRQREQSRNMRGGHAGPGRGTRHRSNSLCQTSERSLGRGGMQARGGAHLVVFCTLTSYTHSMLGRGGPRGGPPMRGGRGRGRGM